MNDQKTGRSVSIPLPSGGVFQFLMVAALITGAFFIGRLYTQVEYLKSGSSTAQPSPAAQAAQQPVVSLDSVKSAYDKSLIKFGDKNGKLVFIEAADPSCPFCHISAGQNSELNQEVDASRGSKQFTLVADGGPYIAPVPEMRKLVDGGKAAYAYLYFNGHGNGELGTKAMYCAFENGKFWEVHDLLMSNAGYKLLNETIMSDTTKIPEMTNFLASVIDPKVLGDCLGSGKHDNRLQEEMEIAGSLGVGGTPGYFVNDKQFSGAYSFKDMEPTVNSFIN